MNTYEENGIIFFTVPYKTKFTEWQAEHLDCDSIIEDATANEEEIVVFCYADGKQHNTELRKVKRERYDKECILRGMDSREVYCID